MQAQFISLDEKNWRAIAHRHREEVEQITRPMRARRACGEKHPVFDFLNTYYSFSLGRLEKWHPGPGILLENAPIDLFPERSYDHRRAGAILDLGKLSPKGVERLRRIRQLLVLTQARPPSFACHGLHEWAMVFSGADIRHRESAPLRLPQSEIDQLVLSHPIACSHFDAYRFFAPAAVSLNRLKPTLETRDDHEQPGCLHANMDLYKWAYKSSPWISSDLLLETLHLAVRAREIDMRAAPYDLAAWGYEPIKIETAAGRREYEVEQKALAELARPLRARLIAALEIILSA